MNTIQVILRLQQIPHNYPMWQIAVYLLMTHGIGCDPRIFLSQRTQQHEYYSSYSRTATNST